ncbi:Rpn family recombination-promoting nuclease/putative transposase [Sphingobacterium faecale]|uniref:Rpn family recombination-promoting nuclease/putative transposase n=1 Tax=Sphingobacterium faecale TaxID=2803775 RepID=A0ABS1RA04_9SPHI|nr:Rpn family recombination-promoting nuclease/putative transposase [Sphingobacterium faecale]MBL1411542.1 Rpn family recombination-promoting nuclease/putative transposase [Sphingobacterium faecale]
MGFGWKHYFGREENKINLINFLNSLLEGEHIITDLQYANVEEDGEHSSERKVVFDLRCIGDGGEHFLVEMQLQNQDFFFDRAVTYTSRTISRLAKKGADGNGYELPPVYFVAVLGFQLDKANNAKYYYSAKIVDQFDQEVLYEKLSYKMLVLPNFNKSKTELSTIMDQWMYLMKHLNEIDELPNYLDKRIFSRIFEVGEVANYSRCGGKCGVVGRSKLIACRTNGIYIQLRSEERL